MALRLPGGIATPSDFWDFLLSKGDARSRVPESRYNIAAFHSTSGKSHSIKTEYGYFLDESVDISALDASFFNMQKAEIDRADPQQRQLLEVTRECLDSAGETNYRGREVGCFIGSFGEDWIEAFAQDDQHHGLYRISGYDDFVLSNRISYEYDLRGPSMTIRAACASSLIALRQACLAIERKECESAIVGGASLILGPGMTITMSEQGVLSPVSWLIFYSN
jgi:acyl transferase domain-containing protein